ncbi:MAG: hypothetical protein Q8P58_00555 [Candidatus Adlerbacteria bacterium]|nr:hypothetical protein [Candidatus Adlerbacteria bacterium]
MTNANVEALEASISDETWAEMSKIINATDPGNYGPGHLRVRRFRSHAERALREAGYTNEQISAAWSRHWDMMSKLVAEARAKADQLRSTAIDKMAEANELELPEELRRPAAEKLLLLIIRSSTFMSGLDDQIVGFNKVGILRDLGVPVDLAEEVVQSRW